MFDLHQKLKNMKTNYKDIHVCLDVLLLLLFCIFFAVV